MKRTALLLLLALLTACQKKNAETTTEKTPPIPVPTDFFEELWFKNGLIYSVDVKVFRDTDGNGFGDFRGLAGRLDYLKDLGVTAVWLAPFQPTPNRDDGYDTSDFYRVDPNVGTEDDFRYFMQEAGRRGIRVMMDLVVNHTSDRHPWFQQARRDPRSPYRSWYVWSEKRPEKWDKGMVFPGVQKATWTYDSTAKAYYYHRFYEFQPDLNAQNPAVLREYRKIVRHWLDRGISGFRLDGVPFLIEVAYPGFDTENPDHQFDLLTHLHQFIQWHKSDAILLGEANVDPKEQQPYFGAEGQGMQMLFNFFANQYLFYALATGEVPPLAKALEETKNIPATAQWATFLRNHDEIDLGRLSDAERETVNRRFGPDTTMQLYDRGIRRRLAPMLGDRRLIDLAYSLLFALPGLPVIRYGEEIGMGDDLRLPERFAIRTPMQWTNGPNAGFSTSDKLIRPVISRGPFGYPTVNVARQQADSASLLNHIRKLSRLRQQCPEIGWGEWKMLETGSLHLLAMRYDWQGRSLLLVHNFGSAPAQFRLKPEGKSQPTLTSLLDRSRIKPGPDGQYGFQLTSYGYGWYRMK
ncbi:alpha-amylase family protein [Larkinella soli]|uniref:alpha-amylase family protein n=1 Tax=Larkinella soli TaxID=1770527 RepID=UPI000FFC61EB|nr:alpha-amylase family protein [Larkinella soli]